MKHTINKTKDYQNNKKVVELINDCGMIYENRAIINKDENNLKHNVFYFVTC